MKGRSATLLDLLALLGRLLDAFGEESLVFSLCFLGVLSTTLLEGQAVTLALENNRGDKTLNLGSLGVGLLFSILGLYLTTDDKLADIIFFARQVLTFCEYHPESR